MQAVEAISSGSHCGGHATATGWWTSASLPGTRGVVACFFGTKAAQKAAATPMRRTSRKLEAVRPTP